MHLVSTSTGLLVRCTWPRSACGATVLPTLFDPEIRERLNLEIHQVEVLPTVQIGEYQVTAIPANHDPFVELLLDAVSGRRWSIFYGVDTASLPEATWQALRRNKGVFDLVILDHTYGLDERVGELRSAARLRGGV